MEDLKTMKKEKITKFGKKYYLLGKRKSDHKKVWLEEGSFDCGWYYGFGYIEIFTKKYFDIKEHTHFDSLFLKNNLYDSFLNYFETITIDKKEVWQLLEYMQTFYTLRKYSDLIHTGGAHITTNILHDKIKNDSEYNRINFEVIPKLLETIYNLLSKEE